jgi:hypothetical protein
LPEAVYDVIADLYVEAIDRLRCWVAVDLARGHSSTPTGSGAGGLSLRPARIVGGAMRKTWAGLSSEAPRIFSSFSSVTTPSAGSFLSCVLVRRMRQCRLDATRRVLVACGDPPDPDLSGFAGTVYLVQVCKEHDPDPRQSMPLPRPPGSVPIGQRPRTSHDPSDDAAPNT